jgi:hypothetical protein
MCVFVNSVCCLKQCPIYYGRNSRKPPSEKDRSESDASDNGGFVGNSNYLSWYLSLFNCRKCWTQIISGVVKTYKGLLACRFFLGVLEGKLEAFSPL